MSKILLLIVFVLIYLSFVFCDNKNKPVQPRDSAPHFKTKGVIDDQFVDINLQSYISAGKWVVLLFYPFDYTFVSLKIVLYYINGWQHKFA